MTNQPASDFPFPDHDQDTAKLPAPAQQNAAGTSGAPATDEFDTNGFTKAAAEPETQAPLVGTMVWGLVLAALAVLTVVVRQTGLVLDLGQTLIWLLLGAGAAMVVGGALSLARRKR